MTDDRLPARRRARAFAKVNLSLEVDAAGADGYHPYVSWATSVGVADTLDLDFGVDGGFRQVSTSTGLRDTLVGRSLAAAAEKAGLALDWRVHIEKRIPPGAGLAGGSADAAAALVAVDDVVGVPGGVADLAVLIGTDVPFCITGGCARLHGRGELVDQADPLPPVGILLVVPPVELSTAEVFGAFDEIGGASSGIEPPATLARALPDCSFRNDLEPAALAVRPDLATWKQRIEDTVARPVLMTGSGSGFVCLADRPAVFDTTTLADLDAQGLTAWVTTPVTSGVELETPDPA